MVLAGGGAKLSIDGELEHDEPEQEYPALYARFAEIIKAANPMSISLRCVTSPTPSCSAGAKS